VFNVTLIENLASKISSNNWTTPSSLKKNDKKG
jgi:hypothetical protein